MARAEKAFTAVNMLEREAPAKISLLGDRKRPEPATHIIEFPGGAIELSRIDDAHYWAHVIINRGWSNEIMMPGLKGRKARVIRSRYDNGSGIVDLPDDHEIQQLAVLIEVEPATRD